MRDDPLATLVMRVQIDGVSGYNKDQVALIAQSSTEFMHTRSPSSWGPQQLTELLPH